MPTFRPLQAKGYLLTDAYNPELIWKSTAWLSRENHLQLIVDSRPDFLYAVSTVEVRPKAKAKADEEDDEPEAREAKPGA